MSFFAGNLCVISVAKEALESYSLNEILSSEQRELLKKLIKNYKLINTQRIKLHKALLVSLFLHISTVGGQGGIVNANSKLKQKPFFTSMIVSYIHSFVEHHLSNMMSIFVCK